MKNRFVVDLGQVDLNERQQQAVEVAVQKAALGALADLDFRGDIFARFPREWLGIWIDIGKEIPFNDAEIQKFAGR